MVKYTHPFDTTFFNLYIHTYLHMSVYTNTTKNKEWNLITTKYFNFKIIQKTKKKVDSCLQ